MEKIGKLFRKNIERNIPGVIMMDGDNISQELEEYVVTEELLKHFYSFFKAYKSGIDSRTEKIGVWISGFYGSGKSHFLKIISYLLENKNVNGKPAVDYFDNKISDKKLLEDIKLAGQVPTDVILFNIDSKNENINGSKDKILDVFEKVFNEKLGLSTTPFVAEIERILIEEGKYEEFKDEFKKICGKNWEDKRNAIQMVEDEFAETYSKVLNKSIEEGRNIISRTEANYTLSIEKFSQRVREYIESKGNNHHVLFLVDEIGQYISSDSTMMLNLQTIVEDLAIECGGKAWVIVTSQRAIDSYTNVIGYDFSKIQGRFNTKLSLSSSDVDEVIKKRVLEKTKEAEDTLKMMYEKEESSIRNLVTFKNAAYQQVYDDAEDFANTYPFIPYQFKLLQDVFTAIRKSAFAGMHMSNGERNLINAFQESAKANKDKEIGALIPFNCFYDTIETMMEPQITRVINHANDLKNRDILKQVDVDILKILFLLKNIKEVPTNIDNISTLYVSNIKDDKIAIKNEVTEALRRLEAQTLIQRNNDEYKFLTDEEQEIDREIKQIAIDQSEITNYLKRIIFDYIYTDSKFTYKNRNFALSKYIDNIKYSQEYEIGIKVVTTSPDRDDTEIIMQSSREYNYLFIKLEISTLIYDEIINYLRVEQYRRDKSGISQTQQIEEIIRAKQRETERAEMRVKENIKENLNNAEIFIAGDIQNINSKEAKERINEALEILVNNNYKKFAYIKHNYTIQDIKELFYANINEVEKSGEFENQKAYEAIKEFCEEKNACRIPMTIRTLLQTFSTTPYGFLDDDILYLLTRLLKNEVVSLIYANEIQSITSEDTLNKILKKEFYDKTLIRIRQRISTELINNLKSVARNAFDVFDIRDDEDGMIEDFKEKCLIKTSNELKKVQVNYEYATKEYQYPGEKIVEEALAIFDSLLIIKDVAEFFEAVTEKKDKISEISTKIESILNFFNGIQKEKFDEARKIILIYDNNKDFADNTEELKNVADQITGILKNPEPYDEIHKLPLLRHELIEILNKMYDLKSKPIIEMIQNTIIYIENELKSAGVNNDFGTSYIATCKEVINKLEHSNELKDIFAQQTRIDQLKDDFINKLECEKNKANTSCEDVEETVEEKHVPRRVIKADMLLTHSYEINSKEDIDKFIEELKEKLIKAFNENRNLTIR